MVFLWFIALKGYPKLRLLGFSTFSRRGVDVKPVNSRGMETPRWFPFLSVCAETILKFITE